MMQIKKLTLLVVILCLFFVAKPTPAFAALPAFDVPKVVGDVVKSVSNFAKKVGEKIKDIQDKVMGKVIGKIQEGRDFAKAQKEKVEAGINQAKEGVAEELSDVKKAKEEAEAYKAKAEKVMSDNKIYLEYSSAKTQVSSIKGSYETSVKTQEENYAAKVAAINQNVETIRKEMSAEGVTDAQKAQYEASITQLELSKKDLEEENRNQLVSFAEERDAALVPAEAEVARIEKELKDKGMGLVENELGKSVDLEDPTAAISEVTKKAFVSEQNVETVAEAKKWLRKDYAKERVTVLSDALRSLNDVAKQQELMSDVDNGFANGVQLVTGSSASVTISNDIKIEQAKALLNHNRQVINKLKLATALQLVNSNIETVNEEQNLSAFSLDDYNYAVQCKGIK